MRKTPLLLILALAAILAAAVAPAARADCVSDASVSYVGSDWGPIPMWRVSVPSMHATWDVQAADADAARAAVAPLISCPAPPADPAPVGTDPQPPAPVGTGDAGGGTTPPPAGPSDSAINAATIILADADVTYVGNSWGPVPIWRVHVPSRSATYDVAAATAEDARAAVLGVVAASIDSTGGSAPDAPVVSAPSTSAAVAAASQGQPVEVGIVALDVVAPFAGVKTVTPPKAKTAKKGVHQAPATAKKKK